jgi:serine/threonine protein kinase
MKQASDSIEYPWGEAMPGTKWVVHGKLGEGGMGIVLDVVKARMIPGAMKVLHPSFAKLPEFADRFLDEVRVTAQLQHPNIVQVLDFDRLRDGTPFMVMERLRGRTLRAALRETRQRGKVWTPGNTYVVAAQVCEGLSRAHSHARAIVHRDVKPENIYLHRPEGSLEPVVKVMDFGVAAVVGQRDRNQIGTPRYMGPEQLRGDRVSPQTDQYALALVIYEMLTGRLPWDVDVRDVSAMAKVHLSVPPAPASRFCAWLPAGIDAAILKALSKDPGARHESVHRLIFELRALQRIDRSPDNTTDANSTDATVGTLADGYVSLREEPDTVGKISPPPLEGEVGSISELTGGAGFGAASSKASPGGRGQESVAEISTTAESGVGSQSAPHGHRPSRRLRRRTLGTLIAACGAATLLAAVTSHALRQGRADRAQPIANQIVTEGIGNIDPAKSVANPPGETGRGVELSVASSTGADEPQRAGELMATSMAPALPSHKIPTLVRPPVLAARSVRPTSSTSTTPNPKARYDKF